MNHKRIVFERWLYVLVKGLFYSTAIHDEIQDPQPEFQPGSMKSEEAGGQQERDRKEPWWSRGRSRGGGLRTGRAEHQSARVIHLLRGDLRLTRRAQPQLITHLRK